MALTAVIVASSLQPLIAFANLALLLNPCLLISVGPAIDIIGRQHRLMLAITTAPCRGT
jgi:hypothetical protein